MKHLQQLILRLVIHLLKGFTSRGKYDVGVFVAKEIDAFAMHSEYLQERRQLIEDNIRLLKEISKLEDKIEESERTVNTLIEETKKNINSIPDTQLRDELLSRLT